MVVVVVVFGREREISLGLGPPEGTSGSVVCPGRVLGRVEGAEPDPSLLPRVSDLGGESAPRSLPHAPESNFLYRRGHRRLGLA